MGVVQNATVRQAHGPPHYPPGNPAPRHPRHPRHPRRGQSTQAIIDQKSCRDQAPQRDDRDVHAFLQGIPAQVDLEK